MSKGLFAVCLIAAAAVIGYGSAGAAAPTDAPVIVQPGAVKFAPVKGMTGVEYGVLYGDPTKAGSQYAARYRIADGVKFPPHTHPQLEQVTVLSGTFMAGIGKTWDATKMVSLPAGAYVAIPADLPHYAQAKGETILEVHGIGPDVMNMVK
ncbi:MAG: cupin domain-containing protein [Candidatus Eremiobacteraeota bacterium]|nr:cupin domain-containing protein [Candidatus Eremiobacteraeota bacterium]MBV8366327.1 cupin domain-containing protein [Candidatus Eremiobacteraeota bacterium]